MSILEDPGMAIEFRCTQCQKLLRTPSGTSGKDARCPQCGAIVKIPAAAEGNVPAEALALASAEGANPYTAPAHFRSPSATDEPLHELRPTRIEIGDVLSRTWEIFKSRWLACMGATWVVPLMIAVAVLPLVGIYVVVGMQNEDDPLPWVFGGIGLGVAALGISTFMTLGLHAFMLKVARGQDASLGDLFGEASLVLPAVLASLIVLVATVLGLALFVVPGVIIALMFSPFLNVMIDERVGPIEALRLSMRITDGNKVTLFLLGLLVAAVNSLAASLTCGLSSFVVAPFTSLLAGVAYLAMTGQNPALPGPIEQERPLGSVP